MLPDHYEVLGVPPEASPVEIRAAYLRVMRACHPDRRPGDPQAEATARRANVAYAVLRDPERRAAYDRVRAVRRPDAGLQRPTAAVVLGQAQARRSRAYSDAHAESRRAFHQATRQIGLLVLAVGVALLLTVVLTH